MRTLPAARRAELQPYPTVGAALDAVRGGDADGALVPIENSVDGAVTVTLDELALGEPLLITREVLLPVPADTGDAITRFVLVSRPAAPVPSTGADKTSVVAFIRDDHPGALVEVLDEFAVRGVNLTRIESRPTGRAIGRYCFSIDAEGHLLDARVGEALTGLRRVCADVRFLGSYPRADGAAATVRPGTADTDFVDAQRWLQRLREGRT